MREEEDNNGSNVSDFLETPNTSELVQSKAGASSTTSTDPIIMSKIHVHNFSRGIYSGTNYVSISDTIVNFLGDEADLLPIFLPITKRNFKYIYGEAIESLGRVKISTKQRIVAGPCRLQNIKSFIILLTETSVNIRAS